MMVNRFMMTSYMKTLFVLVILFTASLGFCAEGLVGSWEVASIDGDTLVDLSGNGHDLKLHDTSVKEFMGRAFLRTGPRRYASGPALGDGWQSLTLTVVVLQERDPAAWTGIACRDNYGGAAGDVFGILSDPQGNWVGRLTTTDGQVGVIAPIETGWHHLAVTYDGAAVRLYLDGKLAQEKPLTGVIVAEPGTPLVLGGYSNLNGWFTGGIASVQIYERALSAEELAAAWEQWQAEHPQATEFVFAQASDTHITDTKSVEIVNDAVDMINADPRVAFSLWLGDLTQFSTSDEMTLARMALDRLRRPYYTLRGNHDLKDGLYEREFGELNYTFEYGGWKFIMLDSNPGDDTPIDAERMQWLREVLAETDREQPLVLCAHHPLYPNTATHLLAGAADVLALFADHNLKAVLGGHHHGNQEEVIDGVLYTTTACLATTRTNFDGTTLRGYRLFHCTQDSITTEFVPVRDVKPEEVQQ